MTAEEQFVEALRGVMHPEIERDLVALGMIKDVSKEDGKVRVTLPSGVHGDGARGAAAGADSA